MRNKLCIALIILCLIGVIFGCAKQTKNEPEPDFEPTPLVIETKDWEPEGVFYGTVVISGPGVADEGYEGLMLITFDGDYIRITCTDAVRSRFGDEF